MSIYCPRSDGNVTYLACQECKEENSAMCDYFFLLVSGGKNFDDYEKFERTLDRLLSNKKDVVIVSDGTPNMGILSKQYIFERGYVYREIIADWGLGKDAEIIKNRRMHEYISKQKEKGVVIFQSQDDDSTDISIAFAKEFKTQTRIVNV